MQRAEHLFCSLLGQCARRALSQPLPQLPTADDLDTVDGSSSPLQVALALTPHDHDGLDLEILVSKGSQDEVGAACCFASGCRVGV